MSTTAPGPGPGETTRAADLLTGPRGRRLLLEFVLAAEELTCTDGTPLLAEAVFDTANLAGPVPPDVVARLAGTVALPDVTTDPTTDPTPDLLATALDRSVCSAMYWEPPDAVDVLCTDPAVRDALVPVAEHVAASPLTDWWWSTPDLADQWTVTWGEGATAFPPMSAEQRADGLADSRPGRRTVRRGLTRTLFHRHQGHPGRPRQNSRDHRHRRLGRTVPGFPPGGHLVPPGRLVPHHRP